MTRFELFFPYLCAIIAFVATGAMATLAHPPHSPALILAVGVSCSFFLCYTAYLASVFIKKEVPQ